MDTGESRSWVDLPLEILTFIAIRLPLLELLSFRGTCKDFRSASTTATAEAQSSTKPWLLIHKPNNPKCTIFNEADSKTYNRHIPDLDDAICLASYQGWLLLRKQKSIFFFSPFSLTKIPLPNLPDHQTDRHVAAFSHIPTSPDCIVSVINPTEPEISIISKGENKWTQHTIHNHFDLKPTFSAATFDHKTHTFYYMNGKSTVVTFSVKDKESKLYTIVHGERKGKDIKVLPYVYCENMFHDKMIEEKMHQLDLEDDEYVDVCGLTYEHADYNPRVYLNEAVNASAQKTRGCKAVWIQPRFFEAHQDLHW